MASILKQMLDNGLIFEIGTSPYDPKKKFIYSTTPRVGGVVTIEQVFRTVQSQGFNKVNYVEE